MSDAWVHALVVGAFGGALVAVRGPWLVPALVVVAALALRRPALLCVAVAVLSSFLSAAARADVVPIPETVTVSGAATLLTDPEPVGTGVRGDVRIDGLRAEARAYGAPAARLADRLAGQSVEMTGRLRPVGDDAPWLTARGVVARLDVEEVGGWTPGAPHHRLANALRGHLVDGARSLDDEELALFTGVVFGDDRAQSAVVADDFRAAGLTHLLAVSGQNVAFVLALCRPFIVRLRIGGRWAAVVCVLGLFATVTRFEASVLRATVMAGLAATADLLGREVSPRRVLSLAVTALVLYRPLLVLSVAFRLSVAATAGIVWFAGPLARRLPGPSYVVLPLAVTVAAQLAVAPVLAATFGEVSLVSLPANLLAGPAAGAMMSWGLGAGLLAGAAPSAVAAAMHLPTRALAWWLHGVAAVTASWPVGTLEITGVWLTVAGVAVWHLSRLRVLRAVGVAVVAATVTAAAVTIPAFAHGATPLGSDSTLYHTGGGTVLVVGARTDATDIAAYLRSHRVRDIGVVVLSSGGAVGRDQLDAVRARSTVGEVWARRGHRIPGAITPSRDTAVVVGGLTLTVTDADPLEVTVLAEPARAGPTP